LRDGATPAVFECPVCRGVNSDDCTGCQGRGRFEVGGCLIAYAGDEVWGAVEAAELAEKGLWPNGGGWLDEQESGMAAIRRVWSVKDRIEAERMAAAQKV